MVPKVRVLRQVCNPLVPDHVFPYRSYAELLPVTAPFFRQVKVTLQRWPFWAV